MKRRSEKQEFKIKKKLNRAADLAQASGRDGSPRARNIIQDCPKSSQASDNLVD
jgi:hypothetical protein